MRVQSYRFYFELQTFNLFLYPNVGIMQEVPYLCKVV